MQEVPPRASASEEAPAREAWALMAELFFENRRRWLDRFGEFGLAPMQAMALRNLDPDEPLAMSALADLLRCDNSNVTGIADRLEAAGLVERVPSPSDRRVKTLALTPAGVKARAAVMGAMSEPPPAIAALPEEDARVLRDVLRSALAGQ